jgi:hypothetical protein
MVVSRFLQDKKPNRTNNMAVQLNAGQETRYALKLAPLLCAIWELRQAEWTEFSLADGRSAYG